MIFTDINGTVKLKGIRRVLEKRGLRISDLKRNAMRHAYTQHNPDPDKLDCCATRLLSFQYIYLQR